MNSTDLDFVENVPYDELQVGQSQQLMRTLTMDDIVAFAAVSWDTNPAHLDPEYASQTPFGGVIAHGMWAASMISALLGTRFPGAGTIYLSQDLRFKLPVRPGDALTATVTVAAKDDEKHRVTLDCSVVNQDGKTVLEGQAKVLAPRTKLRHPHIPLPEISITPA
jgi:phosphate acetyltransferase